MNNDLTVVDITADLRNSVRYQRDRSEHRVLITSIYVGDISKMMSVCSELAEYDIWASGRYISRGIALFKLEW